MYGQIVSDYYQQELIAIRDSNTDNCFRIGDITLAIIRENANTGIMGVYSAVGMFVGKQSRTVREYAAVAAMFTPTIRREFEVLAFDHFREAMKLGDRWHEALKWAVSQTDEMNRPATVDAMLMEFSKPTSENFDENVPDPQMDSPEGKLLKAIKSLRFTLETEELDLDEGFLQRVIDLMSELEKALQFEMNMVQ